MQSAQHRVDTQLCKIILAKRLLSLKVPNLEAKRLKELPVGVLRPGRAVTRVLKRTCCGAVQSTYYCYENDSDDDDDDYYYY